MQSMGRQSDTDSFEDSLGTTSLQIILEGQRNMGGSNKEDEFPHQGERADKWKAAFLTPISYVCTIAGRWCLLPILFQDLLLS